MSNMRVAAAAAMLALASTAESFDYGPNPPGSKRYPGQMNKRLAVDEPKAKPKSKSLKRLLRNVKTKI